MFALAIMFFVLVYIAISVLVVQLARRWARKHGRSPAKAGWLAGLVMYLLVFWDLIPTVLVRAYYCHTAAGVWVYKTVEEWQADNPGVAKTLSETSDFQSYRRENGAKIVVLNQRFVLETSRRKPVPLVPVYLSRAVVTDASTGEIVAKKISVGSGYVGLAIGGTGSWKFWLNMGRCAPGLSEFERVRLAYQRQGVMK